VAQFTPNCATLMRRVSLTSISGMICCTSLHLSLTQGEERLTTACWSWTNICNRIEILRKIIYLLLSMNILRYSVTFVSSLFKSEYAVYKYCAQLKSSTFGTSKLNVTFLSLKSKCLQGHDALKLDSEVKLNRYSHLPVDRLSCITFLVGAYESCHYRKFGFCRSVYSTTTSQWFLFKWTCGIWGSYGGDYGE
jgi:hypothetical protein